MNNSIVKFTKTSKYGSPIFISTSEIDQKTYQTFSKLAHILAQKFPNQYKNVFENQRKTIFIQTFKYPCNWEKNRKYKIDWMPVQRRKQDGTLYVAIKIMKANIIALEPVEEDTEFQF